MKKDYTVTVDEKCSEHGGHNFAYQYDDENFERIESVCEGCQDATPHEESPELQAERASRSHERPQRPAR